MPPSSRRAPPVPELRRRLLVDAPVRGDGDFVLYWMTALRRTQSNFALQRAVELALDLGRPLLVWEALRCGYRWASARLHRFALDGMRDNAAQCQAAGVTYYPYVEPEPGAGRGLLAALAARACAVVGDDYPCFFLPRMLAAAAAQVRVHFEVVDGNGLLPMAAAPKRFERAFDFRRFLQRALPDQLHAVAQPEPLALLHGAARAAVPATVTARWPSAPAGLLASHDVPRELPIDHSIAAVRGTRGGARAAQARLTDFVGGALAGYAEARNDPDHDASSGLSPYLHFGHIGSHQVLDALAAREEWDPSCIASTIAGKRSGWWGMGVDAEAFLDQLVTWRELGFNECHRRDDYDRYQSLPQWAKNTLAEHAADPRQSVYTPAQLERAETHDPLWNAAQRQLVREGRIHNYLRMLWGKNVLAWSPTPQQAMATMVELNDRYALDGRDPNSYSGIGWCLGRYDRPWGPVRPVFGTVRYMTSTNTARKLAVRQYLDRYGAGEGP